MGEQAAEQGQCHGRTCGHRQPCPGYAQSCGLRWRRRHPHQHSYERVGYGGAGWSRYVCACGSSEIGA